MAVPNNDNPSIADDLISQAEEWMYTNTFLADLFEAFGRWRLLESKLPAGHELKLFLQNSLQATNKLRAIYLSHEDKRPDMESQLRSWVNKVEAQIGSEGAKYLIPRKWPVSPVEPRTHTGAINNTQYSSANESKLNNANKVLSTPSGLGNLFVMEDWFTEHKPIEMLLASTCPTPSSNQPNTLSNNPSNNTNSSPTLPPNIGQVAIPGTVGSAVQRAGSSSLISSGSTSNLANNSPSMTPTGSIHKAHLSAAVSDATNSSNTVPSTSTSCHILVEVNDLILWVGQEAVLTLSLFSEDRFVTEEYSIVLTNQSPITLDDRSRKVVFRDIPSDITLNNLWLVAKIVRIGKMKYNDSKVSSKESHEGYPLRRPYACAALCVSQCLTDSETEMSIQDTIGNGPLSIAKAATLRRRQFSNAARVNPFGPDAEQSSTATMRPPPSSRTKMANMRQNTSTRINQNAPVQEGVNTLSMRALNYTKSSNQFMTLYAPTRDDVFPEIHNYIINDIRDKSPYLTFLPKAKGMLVSISKFEGSWAALQHHPAFIQALPVCTSQPLYLPEQQGSNSDSLAPRNDLYVTLEDSFFHDGKSIEIVVEARNRLGLPATLAPSAIASAAPVAASQQGTTAKDASQEPNKATASLVLPCPILPLYSQQLKEINTSIVHRSIPYYRKKDPKFSECFKVDLSRFTDVDHLYMTVKNVSASGKQTEIAFTTLRLYQQDASFIPNGSKKLNGYKIQGPGAPSTNSPTLTSQNSGTTITSGAQKRSTFVSTNRNSLPSFGKSTNSNDDGQLPWYIKSEENLTRSNKADFLNVSINLVSTKITENIPLRALLNWQNSTDPDMTPLLEKCFYLSRKDIINFYKDIFDTLLDLIVLLDDVRPVAFQTLASILATCQSDPLNSHYDEMDSQAHLSLKHWVDRYLEDSLTNTKVYPLLMDSLHKLIEKVVSEPKANHKIIKIALKASPLLIKFILRSRQVAQNTASNPNSTTDFKSGSLSKPSHGPGSKTAKATILTTPTQSQRALVDSAQTSELFQSHGFASSGADGTKLDPSSDPNVLFNPLYSPSLLKCQHLFNGLSKDGPFRKKFLALIDSFTQLLLIPNPSLITLQTLLVRTLPHILQSSLFMLDRDHMSRVIERFLDSLDDANQVQLNSEKLLFLESFQFSPYVGLSVVIKHVKQHIRQSDEERFHGMRIIKSMIRSILCQVFLGELNVMSPIATIDSQKEDEMDFNYTASSNSPRGGQTGSLTKDQDKKRKPIEQIQNELISSDSQKPVDLDLNSRPLYQVLLDLIPSLYRIVRRTEENDYETRRDICTTLLAIIKIVSLKRLKESISTSKIANKNSKEAKQKRKALASLVQLCYQLCRLPTYPLGWNDLILYQVKQMSRLINSVLIPVVIEQSGVVSDGMTDLEKRTWTKLFCLTVHCLRHPALQLELYVANKNKILTYLGGKDLRVNLTRGLWALWQRFEPFRIQLVPESIPALLSLSNSPVQVLAKLSRHFYLNLIGREAQIQNWIENVKKEKVYQTVQPASNSRSLKPQTLSNNAPNLNQMKPPTPNISVKIVQSPPSSEASMINSSSSGESIDVIARARSNNAVGNPIVRPAVPKTGMKRVAAQLPANSNVSAGSSTSSAIRPAGGSSNTPSLSSIGPQGSSSMLMGTSASRLSSEITPSDSLSNIHSPLMPSQSSYGLNMSSSLPSTNQQFSFPRLEVGTIQALEELSKSPSWSHSKMENFFNACKEQVNLEGPKLPTEPITALSPRLSAGIPARTASVGALESLDDLQMLLTREKLPKSLLSVLENTKEQAEIAQADQLANSSFSEVLHDLPPLKTRLVEFCSDMISLITLLASLRDLPRGSEYDEERAYALTQLMTYLRQTKHADAYLKYAYKLSKMYEEAGQYTEAAYAVLLHADMLDWSDRLLPEMLGSASMSSTQRKQQLITQAITLFDKSKAWEDAIKLSSEYVIALKTHLFDYHSLAAQLRLQAELYMKIAEQDRFFSNYFYVAYYGTGFPNALRRKCFIYRGLELERIPHFINRMQKKFPNAEVLKTMDPPASDLTDKNKERPGQYLQIFTVQPSTEEEMMGLRQNPKWLVPNMPEGTRKYHAANNVRVFQYSRPFRKSVSGGSKPSPGDPENEFVDLWISQVFLVTEDAFPNIQRRLEIVTISENVRSPVENAAVAVLTKNTELAELTDKILSRPQEIKIDRLSMALSGILDAAVNGGTAKYQQAFLSEKFINESKDDKKAQENILALQKALVAQVRVVGRALNVHAELCPSNLQALHKRLESQYQRMASQNSMLDAPRISGNVKAAPPALPTAPRPITNATPGALRKKDADARPSIIGLATQMMAKNETTE